MLPCKVCAVLMCRHGEDVVVDALAASFQQAISKQDLRREPAFRQALLHLAATREKTCEVGSKWTAGDHWLSTHMHV
jgi:hypothetical protein